MQRRPADCGFVFLQRGCPIRSLDYSHRPLRVVSGRVSKHRQECPCACCVRGSEPTGVATRGRSSGRWGWGRGRGVENGERRERAMVGTKRGGRNFVNKICRAFSQKIRVGVCDLHRRTFVCQMAFQGLLGMLGSVIPQIIQPERTKVA